MPSELLGRRPATDDKHLVKYPLRTIMPRTIESVERVLPVNSTYRRGYVQPDGSCTGFSGSLAQSFNNHRYYDAHWLYEEAKKIDEWPGEDYEGSSVRAALEVLRTVGHRRVYAGQSKAASILEGIVEYRWAESVDEIRTTIAWGVPAILGIEWFDVFDTPQKRIRDWWLPDPEGQIAGGHAICCYGASDKRQAVKLINSWGPEYPLVWISYQNLEKLLNGFEYPGEAAVITDRL